MDKIKEIRIAYKLAKECGCCPDSSSMDEIIEFLSDDSLGDDQQEILEPILNKYNGATPEELNKELLSQLQAENERLKEKLKLIFAFAETYEQEMFDVIIYEIEQSLKGGE